LLIDTISQPTICVPYIHRTKVYFNADSEKTDGNMFGNGTWTGVFGMLQNREVDVAYMPVTMSSSRWDVVDFTMPAVEMRYCHVYR
jgi:hypothetical protein